MVGELQDGSVVVERGFAGLRYLVRDVLKEAIEAVERKTWTEAKGPA